VNIYIDESGSFVSAPNPGAWNVVAAFVSPESGRAQVERALMQLKRKLGYPPTSEIKLNQIDESSLIEFIANLRISRSILFCTATDAGVNTDQAVCAHKSGQVGNIRDNIPRMRHPGGRQGLTILSDEIERTSNQLYVQLVCQVHLLYEVINRSINFYAQRIPGTLSAFRWRVDQKNVSKTDFERAFEKIAPALLQSMSIREPMPFVKGFNYRKMKRYEFANGIPDYLEKDHGVFIEDAFDVQKLIREDIEFVDSKKSVGIQVVDILASATRRSLRGNFESNIELSAALGSLMVQRSHGRPPIELFGFGGNVAVDTKAEQCVRKMHAHNQSLML
jgi:Protein of unknown function (DUF3800)